MSGAKHVGIVGIEIYFPSVYIDQRDLEKHDEVSEGKYTIGLGQEKMGICSDREDINSLAISAFDKLVRRFVFFHGSVFKLPKWCSLRRNWTDFGIIKCYRNPYSDIF